MTHVLEFTVLDVEPDWDTQPPGVYFINGSLSFHKVLGAWRSIWGMPSEFQMLIKKIEPETDRGSIGMSVEDVVRIITAARAAPENLGQGKL